MQAEDVMQAEEGEDRQVVGSPISIHMFVKCWVPVWIFWRVKSFTEVDYNIYLGLDKYKPQVEHVKREFERLRSREARLQEPMPPGPPMSQEGSGQLIGKLP